MSEVSEVRVILEHVALQWRYGTVDRSVHDAGSRVFSFEVTEALHEFLGKVNGQPTGTVSLRSVRRFMSACPQQGRSCWRTVLRP